MATDLQYEAYNDKSFIVYADPKQKKMYSTIFKGIKGRWNSRARDGMGWMVPRKNEEDLKRVIRIINEETQKKLNEKQARREKRITREKKKRMEVQEAKVPKVEEVKEPVKVESDDEITKLLDEPKPTPVPTHNEEIESIMEHAKSRKGQSKYHRAQSSSEEGESEESEEEDKKSESPVKEEPVEPQETEEEKRERIRREKYAHAKKVAQEEQERRRLEQERIEKERQMKQEQFEKEREPKAREEEEEEKKLQERLDKERRRRERKERKQRRKERKERERQEKKERKERKEAKKKKKHKRSKEISRSPARSSTSRHSQHSQNKIKKNHDVLDNSSSSDDNLDYYRSFAEKPSKFNELYKEHDDYLSSSSVQTSSSDDFPVPESPVKRKKKIRETKYREEDIGKMQSWILDIQRKLQEMELKQKKIRYK